MSTISNYFWKFFEKSGAQLITFITSIVLARILDVEEYGLVAMVMIFIVITDIMIYNGVPTAIIQKKEVSIRDYKTAFSLNLIFSIGLYLLIVVASIIINLVNKNNELSVIALVLGTKIIIDSIGAVLQAYMARNFLFRSGFLASLLANSIAGGLGVFLAFKGYGVWSLVLQSLVNTLLNTVFLSVLLKFPIGFSFELEKAKYIIQYGWKIALSSLIDSLFNQTRKLIIGTKYSPSDLAYMNKGNQFPELIMTTISGTISSVAFSIMSRLQNDILELKEIVRKSIRISTLIIFPILGGLIVVGDDIIVFLLTDKWIDSYWYLLIACVAFMTWPIQIYAQNAIKSLGKSKEYLKIEIIRKIFSSIILIISIFIGFKAIVNSIIFSEIISLIIVMVFSNRVYNYSYYELMKDILPSIIFTAFMMIITLAIEPFINFSTIDFIITVSIGVIFYFTCVILIKPKAFHDIKNSISRIKPTIR